MDPLFLLFAIVTGISLILLTLWLTGSGTPIKIDDEDQVLSFLKLDYPDVQDGKVLISDDGGVAFLLRDNGETGIVRVMGIHVSTRMIQPADLTKLDHNGEQEVTMDFHEPGWPSLHVSLDSKELAEQLVRHLSV